jgi:hypothetical protein
MQLPYLVICLLNFMLLLLLLLLLLPPSGQVSWPEQPDAADAGTGPEAAGSLGQWPQLGATWEAACRGAVLLREPPSGTVSSSSSSSKSGVVCMQQLLVLQMLL